MPMVRAYGLQFRIHGVTVSLGFRTLAFSVEGPSTANPEHK